MTFGLVYAPLNSALFNCSSEVTLTTMYTANKWWVSISSPKQSSYSLIQQCSMLLSLQTCNIQVIFYPKKGRKQKSICRGILIIIIHWIKSLGLLCKSFFLNSIILLSLSVVQRNMRVTRRIVLPLLTKALYGFVCFEGIL